MKNLIMILIALFVSVVVGVAQEKETIPAVIIAPFTASGDKVSQDEVNIVRDMFQSQYTSTGKATVVDQSKYDLMRDRLSFGSTDWASTDRVVELGHGTDAKYVITGNFTSFSLGIYVNIQIFDVNEARVVAALTPALVVKDVADVIQKLPEICENLEIQANGGISPKKISEPDSKLVNENTELKQKIGELEKKFSAEKSKIVNYRIGDTGPGGGYVFYVSNEPFDVYDGKGGVKKCHYLEVSKEELGVMNICSCSSHFCIPSTNWGLGYGKSSIYKIVNAHHFGGALSTKNSAAYACYEYKTSTTNRGDWFLPSFEELYYLYQFWGHKINSTEAGRHWSSSINFADLCFICVNFKDRGKLSYERSVKNCVRAVRAF
ncbi:MAG: DUF1566 domain-containing protein [Treponema sp.]|nr:DUF1566 domain-containing protein [Treponema sp.]